MKEVGSIIIGTKVDNKGLKDGLKDAKTELDNFDKDSKVEIETDTKVDNSATLESLKKERDSLAKSQEALNKRVVVSDYVNESFNKQLRTLDEQIAKLEQVDNITDDVKITYGGIEDELNDINSTLDNTEQKTNEIQLEPFNGSLDEAKEKLEEVQQEIIRLQAEQDKLLTYEGNIDGVKVSYSQGMVPEENEETYNKIQQQLDVLRAKEEQYTNQIRFSNEEIERQAELKRKSSSIQDNITPKIDVEPYTAQLNYLKMQMDELREKAKYMSPDDEGLIKIRAQYAKISQQYDRLLEKQQKFNQNNISSSASLKSVNGTLDKMNNKMSVLARKAVGWGMAIFGVRTAYMAIRQAMNTLSEYDTHLANTISSVKLALTSAIEPVIRRIIDLVVTLINYLNYLTTAWFGLNIFQRASELSTKKTADNLKGAVGSAKALNKEMKQLAGFDEMNVLQDNTPSGGGGGAGGASGIETPEFDLPEVEIPEWLKWIAEHKDEVIAGILGIAGALLTLKITGSLLKSSGIGLIIFGIVYAIMGLLDYLEDPTWENFGKIIQGIGIFVIGLGVAFLGLPGIIAGVAILIWGTIVKYWNQIQAFLQKGIDWLRGKGDWIRKAFGNTIGDMYDNFVDTLQLLLNWVGRMIDRIKANFDEIIKFVKNVFAGNWKGAWENVKNIFKNIWEGMKDTAITVFNSLINLGKNIGIAVGNAISNAFKSVVNAVLWTIENVLNSPIRTVNTLIGTINKLPGISIGKLPTFKLPRLAKGTILNAPGKGVPVAGGSAIAGEAGREAYLPLSDTQLLEELGSTIGRHVVINATIINQMNGRVISRELKVINGESDFAFNR